MVVQFRVAGVPFGVAPALRSQAVAHFCRVELLGGDKGSAAADLRKGRLLPDLIGILQERNKGSTLQTLRGGQAAQLR